MAADVFGQVASMFPSFSARGVFGFITWIIIFIVAACAVAISLFLYLNWMKYKYKILVFERIGGKWKVKRRDRGRELKISEAGDLVLYARKNKKVMPFPDIQAGDREFWFYIRSDGEWINFEMTDLDEVARVMGVHFTKPDMRYARTALQRGMRERYEKKNWLRENAALLVSIGFIAMIGVMTWLLFDKWMDLASQTTTAVRIGGDVLEQAKQVIAGLNDVCSVGSGYVAGG